MLEKLFWEQKTWTTGQWARNSQGKPVHPCSPNAVEWCLLGGVQRCYPETQEDVVALLETRIGEIEGQLIRVQDWNDDYADFELIRRVVKGL
jgi:hypothetical protein